MSKDNDVKVTIDHSGGYCSGCLEIVGLLIALPLLYYLLVDVLGWVESNLAVIGAIVVALIGITLAVVGFVAARDARETEARNLREANDNRRRAVLETEEARRRELERERMLAEHREYELQLSQHQERMRRDKTYHDRWVALCKRRLIAEEVGMEVDNPYLDQVGHSVTDAAAWEYAFGEVPDEGDLEGDST